MTRQGVQAKMYDIPGFRSKASCWTAPAAKNPPWACRRASRVHCLDFLNCHPEEREPLAAVSATGGPAFERL